MLRSKLGALQWLAVQSGPTLVARTNLLLSEAKVGGPMTVAQETQLLLKEAKKWIPPSPAAPAMSKKAFHFDHKSFTWTHKKTGRVIKGK